MKKKSNFYLIKYELLNCLYNGYSLFFGAIFPMLLFFLISQSVVKDVPQDMRNQVKTVIFLGMSMMVPLAAIFLGHSSTYSNEIEKKIPIRLNLFGISYNRVFTAKLIANSIFLVFCLLIFCSSLFFIDILKPTTSALLVWILVLFVFSGFLMALAHGLASIFKEFGKTYAVSMTIYFAIMILGGMMGIRLSDLPPFLQKVSRYLPTTQMSEYYIDFWAGKSYNAAPLIQSMLFFGSICVIVLLISFRVNRRKNSI